MAREIGVVSTVKEMRDIFLPLKNDIEDHPNCYSTDTNPLVRPIYATWREVFLRQFNVDSDLKRALGSPVDFAKVFGKGSSIDDMKKFACALRRRVGMFVLTEVKERAITKVHKKGRLAGKGKVPKSLDWEMIEYDDWEDVYARREVIAEAKNIHEIDRACGHHATSSVALPGIARRRAIVASRILIESGELCTGEVFGEQYGHNHVYVSSPGRIDDGYGDPGWFGEFTIILGVNFKRQEETINTRGERRGIYSPSEGYEIGREIPLANLDYVFSPFFNLPETRRWAKINCPQARVFSREAVRLATGI